MREFLKSTGRRLPAGWFLPVVLLALPNCAEVLGIDDWEAHKALDPGLMPLTSAIMCDIPYVPDPSTVPCADLVDVANGMSKEYAAVALAQGEQNSMVLDFSPAAIAQCPNNLPKKIAFYGPFPDGYGVCLNCGTQMPVYGTADAVCVAQCKDLINAEGGFDPPEGVDKYCAVNAKASTNFKYNECYDNVCSPGGVLLNFPDKRRDQEHVKWDELIGADAPSNTLKRNAPTDGLFSGGGTSDRQTQRIKRGDAWIEFQANETDKGHVLGVSHAAGGDDLDPSFADIEFGISLDSDDKVYIIEGGNVVAGPFGTYATDERFRVRVKDNNDGSASISYVRVVPPCLPGTICTETLIAPQQTYPSPQYPLRVDATLGDVNAALVDVTMVFIHP